jgi:spermidine synthase
MKRKSPPRPGTSLQILICFLLSGAAGLIYQVAWSKALGLIFGHTAYAIATVLAVFMGGLAAGNAFFGQWSKSRAAPIGLYSKIEFLAGVMGAFSLAGLAAVRWLYVAAYSHIGNVAALLALKFVGAAIVLFIPTFLMGGTFPILVYGVTKHRAELASRVSQLYWVNTLGGVSGALIAGFVLLPALGLRMTVGAAVALNIVAGSVASTIETAPEIVKRTRDGSITKLLVNQPLQQFSPRLLLMLFAVVGAAAFAYEIAWTRLLALEIGSSTYAFTLILAAFLSGTVIGGVAFHRYFAGRRPVTTTTFSLTQTWIGIAAVASLVLFHWIPSVIPFLLRSMGQTFGGLILVQAVTCCLTVLPMAAIFGFNFPAVVALLGGGTDTNTSGAEVVGKAYAANTFGAIAGSLIAGFILVPWLGSFRVIAAVAAVNVLMALVMNWSEPQLRVQSFALNVAFLGVALAIGFLPFFRNPSLLSLSAALYGNTFEGHLTLEEIAATNDLVFSTEGVSDSIAVIRSDNYEALRVNGKVDASSGDARTQLLLGHLGAALHPAPRRVLIVGFGSGMTVSAVARYPDVEKIDCIEIEPAVMRAAPYLESLNRGVLGDPRVHMIFDDARNVLLTSRASYDLIISEPSNPWISGVATLFTSEFYSAVRQRLAPGGIFVQWVQSYSLAFDDLRMIAATLAGRFPDLTLWRGEQPDLLFLCRTDGTPLRFERLRALWQSKALRKDFESMEVRQPEALVAYFLLDDAAVRRLGEGSVLNTDDRTVLEYHAPRTLLARDLLAANQAMIAQLRTGALPANLDKGEVGRSLEAGVQTTLDLNDTANAQRFVNELKSQPETVAGYIAQGRLALAQGQLADAQSDLEGALKLDPGSTEAMHWLATAENRDGQASKARLLVDQILGSQPGNLTALDDEIELAADRGDYRIALIAQLVRMKVLGDPPASEFCRLAAIWIKLGNLGEAEPSLLRGVAKDSYSYACNLELGELYRQTGRLSEAQQHLERVLRFYPDSDVTVYKSLAGVYFALGDKQSAQAILRKGRRVFPGDAGLQKASLE